MSITDNLQFYSDYLAHAAEAGLNRARSLYPGIATSTLVDQTTIINRPDSDVAMANLSRNFDTGYEYLWTDGHNISPIRDAVIGLSEYISESTGQDINTFLTEQGIQVEPLYATLANIFGEEIVNANIKGN
jgi:hypothetical protein